MYCSLLHSPCRAPDEFAWTIEESEQSDVPCVDKQCALFIVLPILFMNDIWSTHACCVWSYRYNTITYKTNNMSIQDKEGEDLQPPCNSQFYNDERHISRI